MGLMSFSSRGKVPVEVEPQPTLNAELADEKMTGQPLLLRPASARQKAWMIESVIHARRDMWSKGGYVFVNRQDAGDVVQALSENDIPYDVFPLSGTHEHHLLWSGITHVLDVGRVVVYVDDEALPANKRNEDFKRFLAKVIEQCRKWDEEPAPESWRFMPIFYVDINLVTVSGFAHRMRQASKQFGTFVLTSRNIYDREVDQRLSSGRDIDEVKSVMANSICIFGGGRRNYQEILNSYAQSSTTSENGGSISKDDLDRMREETILAFVAHHENPRIIRLID